MAGPVTLRTDAGDEHLDLVDFEARVRKGEVSPQSLVRLPAVTGDTFVPACELDLYRQLHEPRRAHFARSFSVSRFPWLTSALILLNLGIYLYTVGGERLDVDDMVRFGGKVRPLILDLGQFWRLFTANFLHRDPMHIGLNMFVLFNVGGVLENTYRTLEYLWLLVFAGIATMATSLLLNDAITIGGSGMVFGCLGGIVAFGLKYRSLLPGRYKSIMGDAAIPTVLGLLLIGVTSAGVDNWAHIGGLAAGLLTGAFMRPRLLAEPSRWWWGPALRAAPSLGILTLVFLGHALFAGVLPTLRPERDDNFGFVIRVPSTWLKGANPLGSVAWYNGLSGLGRATFAAEVVETPADSDAHVRAVRFLQQKLQPQVMGPDVISVKAQPIKAVRVGDRDGVQVTAAIHETTGDTVLQATFVPRGGSVYQLIFTWPRDYPGYADVAESMLAGVRFDEPAWLRVARGEALLFPNTPESLARLGSALLDQGEAMAAAEALAAAVRAEPGSLATRVELSRAWLMAGELDRACDASKAAVAYGPEEPSALEADAQCELARGAPDLALARLLQARAVAPDDERLKAVELKLRATLPEPK